MNLDPGLTFYSGALTQLISGMAISVSASKTSSDLTSAMMKSLSAQPLPDGGKIPEHTPAYRVFTRTLAPNTVMKQARADRDVAAFASGLAMLALPSIVAFVHSILLVLVIVLVLLIVMWLGIWLIRRSARKALSQSDLTSAAKSISWRPSVFTWLMICANLIAGTAAVFLKQ